jgi:orotate phosphoribosyltransferase
MVPDPAGASVEELFESAGALRHGHFRLKSGRHSDRYLEKFTVLQYPSLASELCARLAEALADEKPNVVVGPTTGGVLLAFETARHLEGRLGHTVRGLFAEPTSEGGRELRRGFRLDRGARVVLVDDILTTGESIRETVSAVQAANGEPLAAAVLVDRSDGAADVGVPLRALARIEIASWPADECPPCAAGIPLETPGSSV